MAESGPQNVVFILTDDQGPWALGCAGNPEIRTPNLDGLAASGVRFDHFFCASPVCSPARASIMTGRIPSQHGVHDWIRGGNMPPDPARYLDGMECYTDILAARGCVVGLSGKWHLGDSMTPQHGFSHWFTMPKGSTPYNDARMIRDGRLVECPGYVTDVITDDALAFLDAHRAEPFYLALHYNAPHAPWDGHPPDLVASYDDCPFESCPQEPMHPWARRDNLHRLGNHDALKGYFAAVTGLDLGVGRVLERLQSLGVRDRTLVIFMSDNGFSCGHHGFWGKGNGTFPMNMYENSVKVPAIFSQPGRIPGGHVSQAMVSQYDVLPTLLDYLGFGLPRDPRLPGVSFVPVLEGRTDEARDDVVVYDEYGPVRMVRTREWKYVHRYPYGPHELYDLAHDPGERTNLVDEPSRASVVEEMRRRLARWFAAYARPEMDGARLPASGSGQLRPVSRDGTGAEAFGAPPSLARPGEGAW